MTTAWGLDLGTTFSCAAVFTDGRANIVPNEHGNRTTPSWVAFSAGERLVGEAAKNQAPRNPRNTIYDAKRLIGRQFHDPQVQSAMQYWSFDVEPDQQGQPRIVVIDSETRKQLLPEEISSAVIGRMKQNVENYLGHSADDVVITVPAYFNDSQRQATKDAAKIAGLNVLRIVSEPTAAALAYGLGHGKQQTILVVDIGGGTSDFTVMRIDDDMFHVKATGGDTHLGGQDFDNLMADIFVTQFRKKYNIDLKKYPKSLKRLLLACDQAKRTLTYSTSTTVSLDALCQGIDFDSTISRARFEEACNPLFRKCIRHIEQVLIDAETGIADIDEIVLVGGSTRIPKLQSMISEYFGGKELNKSINPDEAIAHGAAIQAAVLSGVTHESIEDVLLIDVAPLSIGVEIHGGLMSVIIPRNTSIPTKRSEEYSTFEDEQDLITISVYEGERSLVKNNRLLGKFHLTDIPKLPRGVPRIQITFEINENGILHVSAWIKNNDSREELVIENEKGRLTKDEIENLVSEAENNRKNDDLERERIETRNELEEYLYKVSNARPHDPVWKEYLETTYTWLEEHGESGTTRDFQEKLDHIEKTLTESRARSDTLSEEAVRTAPKIEGSTSLEDLGLDSDLELDL